jgi:hypothetical protein
MKKYLFISSLVILATCTIAVFRYTDKSNDPRVLAAVKVLENQRAVSNTAATPTPVGKAAHRPKRPKILPPAVTTASPAVFANAVAISSFFSASELAGLTPEQLDELETTLSDARHTTFELLLERGKIAEFPNGSVRVEIPAQGTSLDSMRDYIVQSMGEIVGKERMEAINQSLNTRFDAQFAYFGKYATTLDISFDRDPSTNVARKVTMQKTFKNVSIFGINGGHVSTTDVLYTPTFEADYFPLSKLQPRS